MTRALTLADLSDPREAAFVAALLELGGPQYAAAAALSAGYADNEQDAERAAAFLLGASRINRAIVGEIKARFDTAATAAFAALVAICADPKSPANARISAAQEILNRSSLGPIPSRSFSVSARSERSIEDILEEIDARNAEPGNGP